MYSTRSWHSPAKESTFFAATGSSLYLLLMTAHCEKWYNENASSSSFKHTYSGSYDDTKARRTSPSGPAAPLPQKSLSTFVGPSHPSPPGQNELREQYISPSLHGSIRGSAATMTTLDCESSSHTNVSSMYAAEVNEASYFYEEEQASMSSRDSWHSTDTSGTYCARKIQPEILDMPSVVVSSPESNAAGDLYAQGKAPVLSPGVKNFSRPVRRVMQTVNFGDQDLEVLSLNTQHKPSPTPAQARMSSSTSFEFSPSPSSSQLRSPPHLFQESPDMKSSRFSGESQYSLAPSELQSNRPFGFLSGSRFGRSSPASPAPRKPSKLIKKFKALGPIVSPSHMDHSIPPPTSPSYRDLADTGYSYIPPFPTHHSGGSSSPYRYRGETPSQYASASFVSGPLLSSTSENVDYLSDSAVNMDSEASPARSPRQSPIPAIVFNTSSSSISPPVSEMDPLVISAPVNFQRTHPVVLPGRPPSPRAGTPTSIYSNYSFYQLDSPSDASTHPSPTSTPSAGLPSLGTASHMEPQSRSPSPLSSTFPSNSGHRQTPQEYLLLGIQHHEANRLQDSAACFERSAKEQGGCAVGMLMWGLTLRHGWGCEKNERSGFNWLRKAAESAVENLESTREGMEANAVKVLLL
jgi:hypothetical protein